MMVCPLNWRLAEEELALDPLIDAEPALIVADAPHSGEMAAPDCRPAPRAGRSRSRWTRSTLSSPGRRRASCMTTRRHHCCWSIPPARPGGPRAQSCRKGAVMANARSVLPTCTIMTAKDHVLTASADVSCGRAEHPDPARVTVPEQRVTVMDRFDPWCLPGTPDPTGAPDADRASPRHLSGLDGTRWIGRGHRPFEPSAHDCHGLDRCTGSDLIRSNPRPRRPRHPNLWRDRDRARSWSIRKVEPMRESQVGSIGRAGPGVDVRITGHETVQPCPMAPGQQGEIWLQFTDIGLAGIGAKRIRERCVRGRLVPYRRRGPARRRTGFLLVRRPDQECHHLGRREHLPGRTRTRSGASIAGRCARHQWSAGRIRNGALCRLPPWFSAHGDQRSRGLGCVRQTNSPGSNIPRP